MNLDEVVFNILKEQIESKSQHSVTLQLFCYVVFNILKEQIESKSQQRLDSISIFTVVFNILKEQIESKSQPFIITDIIPCCCF